MVECPGCTVFVRCIIFMYPLQHRVPATSRVWPQQKNLHMHLSIHLILHHVSLSSSSDVIANSVKYRKIIIHEKITRSENPRPHGRQNETIKVCKQSRQHCTGRNYRKTKSMIDVILTQHFPISFLDELELKYKLWLRT